MSNEAAELPGTRVCRIFDYMITPCFHKAKAMTEDGKNGK